MTTVVLFQYKVEFLVGLGVQPPEAAGSFSKDLKPANIYAKNNNPNLYCNFPQRFLKI